MRRKWSPGALAALALMMALNGGGAAGAVSEVAASDPQDGQATEKPRPEAPAEEPDEPEEPAEPEEPPPSAEELRAAAAAAAEDTVEAEERAEEEPAATTGRGSNLNRLNPEISLTGDAIGVSEDAGEDFEAREFELDLQADLDPFSRTKVTLAFSPEEGVDIEEGYVIWSGLGHGLSLKGGKIRQEFGRLNRYHLHALPQVDYPPVLTTYFGEEGLAQTGISVSWLLPRPWADANRMTVEVTDGAAEAFAGEDFERLVVLGRFINFWDLSPATYLEWGLSAADGRAAGGLATTIAGTDLTLHWQPPARAKYREFTWRTEVLRSEREVEPGIQQEAWGGYSYVETLLRRNLYAGVRLDRVEDPVLPGVESEGFAVNLSWWQSEYVRLRAEYGRLDHSPGETEDRIAVQLTWAAGPHKHENY